jgi:hypothetical protein
MKPMLLGADHHSGAHETHVRDDFIGGEAVSIDEICSNEAASSTETSFAMNGNPLLSYGDHIMGEIDELPHERERRACAVVKDHVQMLNAKFCEI